MMQVSPVMEMCIRDSSIVAAIRFIDAAKGDFNVADDSEAIIKGGFRNFPMNNFGVLSFHLKQLAESPVMPVPLVACLLYSSRCV